MQSEPLYIRNEWKQKSELTPVTWGDLFQKVLDHPHRIQNQKSVVIFDLDSTLYNVQPRTFEIIREWRESSHSKPYNMLREIAHSLSLDDIHYSLKDTFEAKAREMKYEIHPTDVRGLRAFWSDRFFSSEYLKHDHIYPGALEAVKNVHEHGFKVLYLTGREAYSMERGTRARLADDGFPMNAVSTGMILRTDVNGNDLDHKVNAVKAIHEPIICSIENEPANLVAMQKARPEALHVLKDTVCSDKPAPKASGVFVMKSFR